jgi:hypothetical protein
MIVWSGFWGWKNLLMKNIAIFVVDSDRRNAFCFPPFGIGGNARETDYGIITDMNGAGCGNPKPRPAPNSAPPRANRVSIGSISMGGKSFTSSDLLIFNDGGGAGGRR